MTPPNVELGTRLRRRRNIAGGVILAVCSISVLALLKAHQVGLARAQAITMDTGAGPPAVTAAPPAPDDVVPR